jgi:hypothetical protein
MAGTTLVWGSHTGDGVVSIDEFGQACRDACPNDDVTEGQPLTECQGRVVEQGRSEAPATPAE